MADRDRIQSPRADGGPVQGPFYRCVEMLKQRGEPFSISNIKKALRDSNKAPTLAQQAGLESTETSGRWTIFHEAALQLTSNTAVTTDAQRILNQLINDSYSSNLLPSILRVIWNRLGDCKGLKWRHASKGMVLLKELLIRGPESVLSDTLSNISTLRSFLEYRSGLGQGYKVRESAREVFFLVLDGRQYLLLRNVVAGGKKKFGLPRVRLTFEHALSSAFEDIHRVLTPSDVSQSRASGDLLGLDMGTGSPGASQPQDFVEYEGSDLSVFATEPSTSEFASGAGEEGYGDATSPPETRGARAPSKWETFNSGSGSGVPSPDAPAPAPAPQRWEAFGSGSPPAPAPPVPTGGPPPTWVNFDSGSPGPTAPAPAPRAPPAQWEQFSSTGSDGDFRGGVGAPPKPERRRSGKGLDDSGSGAAPARGMVPPSVPPPPIPMGVPPAQGQPLLYSTSPAQVTGLMPSSSYMGMGTTRGQGQGQGQGPGGSPPLIQLSTSPPPPLTLPPSNLFPIQPVKPGPAYGGVPQMPIPGAGPYGAPQPPYGAYPQPQPGVGYGMPQGYPQQPYGAYGQAYPVQPQPGVGYGVQPGLYNQPRPTYGAGYDPFAEIEKDSS
jgi:hypothetical protein